MESLMRSFARYPFLFLAFMSVSYALELRVTITHITPHEGEIRIGLFKDAKHFRDPSHYFIGATLHPKAPSVTYTFTNLPKGTYALSLFHDTNHNGVLDTNLFGIPKEGYGFSQNPKTFLNAPEFDACQFTLFYDHNITIEMQY